MIQIYFTANGIGASGKQDYCLDIELYKPLQPTVSSNIIFVELLIINFHSF